MGTVPKVAVEGTQLHYERRGEGPPLLLVQDHRGIGRSAALEGDLTIAGLAGDALALLDELRLADAHVLGVSMGGMVAQELALAAPQRIRTLTLGCTSCGGTQSRPTSPQIIQRLTAAVLSRDFDRLLRTGFELVVSPGYASDPAHHAAFVEAAHWFPAPLPVLMDQKIAVEGHDTYARLRAVRTPTLVLHGTADELLAPINGELVASLIPRARLELLEGVGHLFFWEQPQRSAELIRQFALDARVLSSA